MFGSELFYCLCLYNDAILDYNVGKKLANSLFFIEDVQRVLILDIQPYFF